MQVDQQHAEAFATSWIEAWNSHDVERVLAHFADDVVFTSPLIATLLGDPSSTVTGIGALRAYWSEGLRRIPDLRFELVHAFAGADVVAIAYTNQAGRPCLEVVELDGDGRVGRGQALYG